jgi:hypothetical protein
MYSLETVWPNMSHLDKVRIPKQRKTKQSGGALTINCVNKREYMNIDKLQEVLVGNRCLVTLVRDTKENHKNLSGYRDSNQVSPHHTSCIITHILIQQTYITHTCVKYP